MKKKNRCKKLIIGATALMLSAFSVGGITMPAYAATIHTVKGAELYKNGDYYYCKGSDNKIVKNKIVKIHGGEFYFDAQGKLKTGMVTIEGDRYYFFGASSAKKRKLPEGQMCKNETISVGGKTYKFGADGIGVTGVFNNKLYNKGLQLSGTGFKTVGGKKYYLSNGTVKKGIITVKGKKYFLDSKGVLNSKAGFKTYNKKTYYVGSDGVIKYSGKGLTSVSGKKYYFQSDGSIVKATVKDSRLFDANGVLVSAKGFKTVSGNKYYVGADGKVVKSGWKTIQKSKYYFKNYKALKGVQKINGKNYLFDTENKLVSGSGVKNGYLLKSSVLVSGLQTINNNIYHANSNFKATVNSLKTIGNDTYFFNEKGIALKSTWKTVNKKTYYFNKNGKAVNGWQTISKTKYYFDKKVQAKSTWKTINNKKYYFGSDGKFYAGFKTISGAKYYFNKKGQMLTGWQTISGSTYYLGTDGKVRTNWQTISGKKYYFGSDGKMRKSWQTINGKKYYFGVDGKMRTGTVTISGKKYYFDSNGVLKTNQTGTVNTTSSGQVKTGLQKVNNAYYYYNSNGTTHKGWKTINGYTYYFGSNGKAVTGWKTINNKKYYFGSDGKMFTGARKIGSDYYYFNSNGTLRTSGNVNAFGMQFKVSSSGKLITLSEKRYTTFIQHIKDTGGAAKQYTNAGYQCVDLIKDYIQWVWGLTPSARGDAYQYYTEFYASKNADLRKHFDLVAYSNGKNLPKKGDIVVWSKGIGPYGHIAIATGENYSGGFKSYDQNWGADRKMRIINHNYGSVLGYLRPKDQSKAQ